ncbi:hypothetical protein PM082_010745 [Marasmius tenuissimus]|nr:hypothetical protein PM082_010745 [Marasmius tenuissimus]
MRSWRRRLESMEDGMINFFFVSSRAFRHSKRQHQTRRTRKVCGHLTGRGSKVERPCERGTNLTSSAFPSHVSHSFLVAPFHKQRVFGIETSKLNTMGGAFFRLACLPFTQTHKTESNTTSSLQSGTSLPGSGSIVVDGGVRRSNKIRQKKIEPIDPSGPIRRLGNRCSGIEGCEQGTNRRT